MKAFLIVQNPGPMCGHKVPISGARFTIGRAPGCSLEAADPAIAEQHCALEIREGAVCLQDLESAGGTFVNDARVAAEIRLQHGDRVQVGSLLFRVSIETPKAKVQLPAEKTPSAPSVENASNAAQKLLLRYLRDRRR